MLPSETMVTTSVVRRGAVSARVTRMGLTVGQVTDALDEPDSVDVAPGVPGAVVPGVDAAVPVAVPVANGEATATLRGCCGAFGRSLATTERVPALGTAGQQQDQDQE